VGTYRDVDVRRTHPLQRALADLRRQQLFERVLLRGLTRDDVGRFIELAAGVPPPEALVQAVFVNTEGNPLFVSEVVRLLVQEGALAGQEPGGRGPWSLTIPEGVREVIGRRLNRLSDRSSHAVHLAAVLGREFTLKKLGSADKALDDEQLLEVAEELLSERLIEEQPEPAGAYRFTHALVRQTLLEELSVTRRAKRAGRAGAGADVRARCRPARGRTGSPLPERAGRAGERAADSLCSGRR
jgi:predicted ATPase